MKSTRILLPSLIFGIAGGFALTGCIEQKQTAAAEPDMLQKDTTVYLQEGKETPSCKISISYAYLKPTSEKDSISRLINEKIQEEAFGQTICTTDSEDLYRHWLMISSKIIIRMSKNCLKLICITA